MLISKDYKDRISKYPTDGRTNVYEQYSDRNKTRNRNFSKSSKYNQKFDPQYKI